MNQARSIWPTGPFVSRTYTTTNTVLTCRCEGYTPINQPMKFDAVDQDFGEPMSDNFDPKSLSSRAMEVFLKHIVCFSTLLTGYLQWWRGLQSYLRRWLEMTPRIFRWTEKSKGREGGERSMMSLDFIGSGIDRQGMPRRKRTTSESRIVYELHSKVFCG